eukprot:TRINITY_DN9527_c1_g3_i1.p1 TRINITY_DN9527_c1_g3~~TRINITY_DN9527_c1_g3_i1.p1  ORF type:complete len:290 (+),score=78.93 TRINITY_DN9527_c1_g3_i1:204-1073(+)
MPTFQTAAKEDFDAWNVSLQHRQNPDLQCLLQARGFLSDVSMVYVKPRVQGHTYGDLAAGWYVYKDLDSNSKKVYQKVKVASDGQLVNQDCYLYWNVSFRRWALGPLNGVIAFANGKDERKLIRENFNDKPKVKAKAKAKAKPKAKAKTTPEEQDNSYTYTDTSSSEEEDKRKRQDRDQDEKEKQEEIRREVRRRLEEKLQEHMKKEEEEIVKLRKEVEKRMLDEKEAAEKLQEEAKRRLLKSKPAEPKQCPSIKTKSEARPTPPWKSDGTYAAELQKRNGLLVIRVIV